MADKNDNECSICLDNNIDKRNNCIRCKNGMCNCCCNKLIDKTFANLNDVSYICPFCKIRNYRNWENIDNTIIIKFFKENEKNLQKEIWKYKEIIFDKDVEINRLQRLLTNKKIDLKI
jgi:hypothetical protein